MIKARAKPFASVRVHGRSGLNALGQRFAARKSLGKKKKKKKKKKKTSLS